MLRGRKERKKKEQIYKVKQRQMKIYIHERLTARGKQQQEKQTKKKCRKNYRFKKLEIKIIKKQRKKENRTEKGKLHRTAKAQCRGRGL